MNVNRVGATAVCIESSEVVAQLRAANQQGVITVRRDGSLGVLDPGRTLSLAQRLNVKKYLQAAILVMPNLSSAGREAALAAINARFVEAGRKGGREISPSDAGKIFFGGVLDQLPGFMHPRAPDPQLSAASAIDVPVDAGAQTMARLCLGLARAVQDLQRHPEPIGRAWTRAEFKQQWSVLLTLCEPGSVAAGWDLLSCRHLLQAIQHDETIARWVMLQLPRLIRSLAGSDDESRVRPAFALAAALVSAMTTETLESSTIREDKLEQLFEGAKAFFTLMHNTGGQSDPGRHADPVIQAQFLSHCADPNSAGAQEAIEAFVLGAGKQHAPTLLRMFGILMVNAWVKPRPAEARPNRQMLKSVRHADNYAAGTVTYAVPNPRAFFTSRRLQWGILRSCPAAETAEQKRSDEAAAAEAQ